MSTAFIQGMDARSKGTPFTDNPFCPDEQRSARYHWTEGWYRALDEEHCPALKKGKLVRIEFDDPVHDEP